MSGTHIFQVKSPIKLMEPTKSDQRYTSLVHFFDVGINEEGYWNYNQIDLQVEDVFDVLAIKKYPQYDIVFMMEQSSGHGKMRDGTLNANLMAVRYGGKQGK